MEHFITRTEYMYFHNTIHQHIHTSDAMHIVHAHYPSAYYARVFKGVTISLRVFDQELMWHAMHNCNWIYYVIQQYIQAFCKEYLWLYYAICTWLPMIWVVCLLEPRSIYIFYLIVQMMTPDISRLGVQVTMLPELRPLGLPWSYDRGFEYKIRAD